MRRWRVGILLLIVLPVYAWVQMGIAICICFFIAEPGAVDFEYASDIFNPLFWVDAGDPSVLLVILPGFLLAATQVAFLLPVFSRRVRGNTQTGRPLKLSIIAAALAGAILTVGLLYSFVELWIDDEPFPWNWASDLGLDEEICGSLIIWGQIVIGWFIWSVILLLFMGRGNPRTLHRRLVMVIFAGTLIELLITIPIDIMVRRRTDCYCATGSFIALCCSVWAIFWLCGPGAVLLLTRKRRRLWGDTHCLNCGYAKGPSPGPRCSECGYDWDIKNRADVITPAREK